jgi:hypothetical protein
MLPEAVAVEVDVVAIPATAWQLRFARVDVSAALHAETTTRRA